MGLAWSDERPPNKECPYNHVVADTPLGRVYIEWKGWKDAPAYTCCFDWMPDLDHFCGSSLSETKELVQDGWDRMAEAIIQALVANPAPDTPPGGEGEG